MTIIDYTLPETEFFLKFEQSKIKQDLRKFGDVTLDVGVIHELPLLLFKNLRNQVFLKI
ncbi:hypothetical protein PL9631_660056 [Planktothrix paucivesiculata PCC 9631]|uniref:Uncharacterized protein n=1 Tax=Planktothrix paucivesiculata PCC 9631 TaxID=671071 RepID=A0A7Z9BTI5_9CYAN|nr:hypothetical protein PL9631_660056 [Planktothrix paucivesiculata PCC 9631]